ncbi:ABC transporter [Colletotrichum tofieldiae]|uniref:ABC transporter n=1 Tax=Colletotrichum tofieldiae TaxID=708197 RepID=A0A166UWQ4_9PEZI|nr:ABC transporter [Colletotrichum tofieldiae]
MGTRRLLEARDSHLAEALARATYSRKPVLVVDDALSGLDVSTQHHVWNCFFSSTGLHKDPLESWQQTKLPIKDAEVDLEQNFLRKTGDIILYWYYLKSIGWLYGLAGVIFLVLDCFVRFFPQLWLKFWTEDDIKTGSADTAMYFGVYCAISLIGLIVIGINVWFVKTLTYIGRYLTVLDCLAGGILIMVGAKYLAAAIPLALIALYFLQAFYLRTSRQMRFLDLQAQAPLLTKLIKTIDGLSTIRAFG